MAVGSAGEVAWRIDVYDRADPREPFAIEEVFERFLDAVDTSRVTALVFGNWARFLSAERHPGRLLAENAHRLPELRALFLGDVVEGEGDDECDIVYIEHDDLMPILVAYPALEELWVRGTSRESRFFEPLRHTGLRRLVLQSGGLHPDAVRAISVCDLPELRHLELYLGHPNWMGHAEVADLARLMAGGTFPKLDHLGLRNSLIQDEIAAAVASAPVVAGLQVLDLSLGALGDDGAEALLRGQPLGHLTVLDLHHNYFSQAMRDRLRAAWPGVDVDLSWHRTVDESGRRYVGIGA